MTIGLYIPHQKVSIITENVLSDQQNEAIWEGARRKNEMMLLFRDNEKDVAKITYTPQKTDEYHNIWEVELQNCQDILWGEDGYMTESLGWMQLLHFYDSCRKYIDQEFCKAS